MFIFIFVTVLCTEVFSLQNDCGGIFYKKSGNFSSPNFRDFSSNNKSQNCQWRLSTTQNEKIIFKVEEIDIEKSINCNLGYIEIRDGFWRNSPLLGRFCGMGSLDPVSSTNNKMLISYFYPNPMGHRGFYATFESICGGDLFIENNYILESHESGRHYALNTKCLWRIFVQDFYKVVVNFQDFQLEKHDNCSYDYVEVRDGAEANSSLLGKFCGDQIRPNFISTSNSLSIKFVSDSSVAKEGFSALIMVEYDECSAGHHGCAHFCRNTIGKYECFCRNGYDLRSDGKSCELSCGGSRTSSSGIIQSPNFPNSYPPNKTCTWEIINSERNVIKLNFSHFDLDGQNFLHNKKMKCDKDKLEIFNKINETTSQRLKSFCGNTLPNLIALNSPLLQIVFTSNNQEQKSGFLLNYKFVKNKCDTFNGNCHHRCTISNDGGRKCTCENNFLLDETNLNCYNGCHYEISSISGQIYSPNWPDYYPNLANCSWKFITTPGHRIRIEMQDFGTESSNGQCAHDYVEFYDGLLQNSPILKKACGSTIFELNSSKNRLLMIFKTDGSDTFNGFQGKYSSLCGGTFTSTSQEDYIFSHAEFALFNYTENINCEWIIMPNSEKQTILKFDMLDLEESDNCEYDFVEIFESDLSLGKFCGRQKPPQEFIGDGNFKIKFQTDDSNSAGGFKIIYKSVN